MKCQLTHSVLFPFVWLFFLTSCKSDPKAAPLAPTEDADELARRLIASEETVLELTPKLGKLARSIVNGEPSTSLIPSIWNETKSTERTWLIRHLGRSVRRAGFCYQDEV
jgi:hypothetical protein